MRETANELPHIHIWKSGESMQVWLNEDLEIAECCNVPAREQTKLLKTIKDNKNSFWTNDMRRMRKTKIN